MTRVDFYVLTEAVPEARVRFTCRLTEQIYRSRNHRVYIHAANEQMAHELDEALWNERAGSFLPHNLVGEGPEPPPPIQVGHGAPPGHRDVLINLADSVPEFAGQFERVAEVVDQRPEIRAALRDHYRHYQERGYPLQTHKL